MRHPLEHVTMAMNVADHTPLAETAKAVCLVRGIMPYHYAPSAQGLCNWQAVICEAAMMSDLIKGI